MELSVSKPASLQSRNDQVQVSRKRNRLPVSCGHCRRRKQKCDRANPCAACARSGDAATCSYVSDGPRDEEQMPPSDSREDTLMARIDRLEQLLIYVVANGAQSLPPGAPGLLQSTALSNSPRENNGSILKVNASYDTTKEPEVNQLAGAFGIMHVDQAHSKSIYVGGAHWLSILCQIEDFRNYLMQHHEELEYEAIRHQVTSSEITGNSSSLLRGTVSPATREELLSSIPPRAVVDKLVTQFFAFYSMNSPFIHEPTFRKEYLQHWNDPTKTKIIWLGLLFAMMRLAQLAYIEAEEKAFADQDGGHGVYDEYKRRTIECLVAADYTNPVTYTVETLILYIGAEWLSSQDAGIEVSLVLGMAIRLAMRMGIHRDSSTHPDITPFQGEMRRRIWAVLREMDILYSFQISLPTIIRQSDCDCALLQNIYDDDFNEDTVELPPSRDSTEATVISYTITKYRFTLLLGEIVALAESPNTISPEDVLKYENALHEARRMTPPHLQIPTAVATTSENIFLTKQRINVDRIYQLAQCILHRKFLLHARHESACIQHRRYCMDAALSLLNYQATLYLECNTTYPQNIEKRHLSTLSTHDFFAAGMAVALDLHYGYRSEPRTAISDDIRLWGFDRRVEMITALETSNQFWRICKDYSVEAAKAYGIFSFVLMKAKKAQWIIDVQMRDNPEISDDTANQPEIDFLNNGDRIPELQEHSGFDLNPWNVYSANNEEFESLLNWSPKSPDNYTAPSPMKFS